MEPIMCIAVVWIVEGSTLIHQREIAAVVLGRSSSERLISPSANTLALCDMQVAGFFGLALIESLLLDMSCIDDRHILLLQK